MSLFRRSSGSYAYDRLNHSLTSLSTIPVTVPNSVYVSANATGDESQDVTGSECVQAALKELAGSKPITRSKLLSVLSSLTQDLQQQQQQQQQVGTTNEKESHDLVLRPASPVDAVLLIQITARAVTVLWREVLDVVIDAANEIERERMWWEDVVGSRTEIGIYFLQSLPLRLFALLPHPLLPLHLQPFNMRLTSLFRHRTARDLPLPGNPITLTRREIISSLHVLKGRRDSVAEKIGFLASHAPKWEELANRAITNGNGHGSGKESSNGNQDEAFNLEMITSETTRIYALLCVILDLPLPIPSPPSQPQPEKSMSTNGGNSTPRKGTKNQHTHTASSSNIGNGNGPSSVHTRHSSSMSPSSSSMNTRLPPPSVQMLLPILRETLPQLQISLRDPLRTHGRPSRLTRLWMPALLLPPIALYASRSVKGNQEWIRSQIRNAGETIRGWVVGWVWEPIEGMAETLRGGGEGLGVAPQSVQSDKASLERMVLDLGRDYYHLDGPALDALKQRVNKGDMEDVLKVYEGEMRSPVKNAVMGSLIRTLLIQVQKTKTDLSLSLLSLDHLLKSQQLTFAFVGLAPSLLVLYGLWGWAKGVWTGEKRGKSRRIAYSTALRDTERIILTATAGAGAGAGGGSLGDSQVDQKAMSDKDRGLLLLSVGRVRVWAAGLRGRSREDLLDDLRLLEDSTLSRSDKLFVVNRIWRGWGYDGRRAPAA